MFIIFPVVKPLLMSKDKYIIENKFILWRNLVSLKVIEGSPNVKSMLEVLLHEKGAKETGLREFLKDLEETEAISGSWWAVMDANKQPRGALTVRYLNDTSYLRSVWTRVSRMEDAKAAAKELFGKWIKNSRKGTKKFQADLPLTSPLTQYITDSGFKKYKILLVAYDLETSWDFEELPENYIMRSVNRDELDKIYKNLVSPDLDQSSPIYISPEAFRGFAIKLPDSALQSWVGVEDDTGKLVGFGASFLSIEKEETRAILYGPHSKEPIVLRSLIAEMSTYWKSNELDNLRILRVNEFHPDIIDRFSLKLAQSTIRYVKG